MTNNNAVKMAVLLAGHCFVRPSDFVPGARPPIFHFRRLGGWWIPAVPAVFYAAANIALVEQFILTDEKLQVDAVQQLTMLQHFHEHQTYLRAVAFAFVAISCYFSAAWMFIFHQTICRLFGPEKTSAKHANFRFFLVKSSIGWAWFTILAWAVVLILKIPKGYLEQLPAHIEPILSSYSLFVFGFILIVYFVVELCRMNGRLAMLEIYQTEATYHDINVIRVVTLATMIIFVAFLPRVLGG